MHDPVCLIGGEAGASLAIPTLMGFGTYEAGSMFALAWMGFSAAAATTVMLTLHIWSQIVDYVLGGSQPPATGQDGRMAIAMGYAARKSYAEHRPVALTEV